jgi:acetyltransferase
LTVRNFDAIFDPKAIALVGASNQPDSVGAVLARNLTEAGFAGPILMVNPHERFIRSRPNNRRLADLPMIPDLAVVATPPAAVPGVIAELGARGCRAAVVVTAGFGEGGHAEGERLRQAMLDASRPHLLRILGPNCLGFLSPGRGINASFAHLNPAPGDLAFVTQSGALATAVLDWASARGVGFSHVVSVGDMADIDFGDLLDYLALDTATRAILLYVESITHARKFMSAARIASRSKPVVVIKSGRSSAGARAALSHTGALAGSDHVYDAAFRRAGMLRVAELRELFEAVTTLSAAIEVRGDRLVVLTNGGGAGGLAADALEARGGRLTELSEKTIAALDAVLPHTRSRGNPVDILGDAPGARPAVRRPPVNSAVSAGDRA